MTSKYKGKYFVMITSGLKKTPKELQFTQAYFNNRFFTRDEFLEFTGRLVRMRPGYRSEGGGEYDMREAGCRFSTLLNTGIILQVSL